METSDGSKRKLKKGILITFAILSILYACTKTMDNMNGPGGNTGNTGGDGGPGINEVWIQGMAFNPSTITVAAGTTITWTNKDAVTHNVISNTTGLFESPSLGANGTFSKTFNTMGTFGYKCTFHPTMTGTVIVN
jgi:plastocyanin